MFISISIRVRTCPFIMRFVRIFASYGQAVAGHKNDQVTVFLKNIINRHQLDQIYVTAGISDLASRMHSYFHDRLRLRAEIGLSGSSRALVELPELAGDFHGLPALEAPLPRARTACLIPTAQTIAISPLPDLSSLALIEVSAHHYPPRHSRRGRSSKGISRLPGIFCSRP